MRASDVLPWLFFGPLAVAIVGNLLWQITGWPFLPAVIKAALGVLGIVVVTASVAGWQSARRVAKPPDGDPGAGDG